MARFAGRDALRQALCHFVWNGAQGVAAVEPTVFEQPKKHFQHGSPTTGGATATKIPATTGTKTASATTKPTAATKAATAAPTASVTTASGTGNRWCELHEQGHHHGQKTRADGYLDHVSEQPGQPARANAAQHRSHLIAEQPTQDTGDNGNSKHHKNQQI